MGFEDRSNTMIGVSGAFLAIAWIAFSLRTFVKGYIMKSWGLDDWLMVITIVSLGISPLNWTCTDQHPARIYRRQRTPHHNRAGPD